VHIQVTQDHASKTFVKRNYRFSGEKSLCVCVCHMAIPQGGPINITVVRLRSLPTYVVVSGSGKARFELSRCSSDLPSSPSGHAPGHEAGSYVLLVLDSCFFVSPFQGKGNTWGSLCLSVRSSACQSVTKT